MEDAARGKPTEQQIREELRKQGIRNLDDLIQEAARRVREEDGPSAERYFLVGSGFVLMIPGGFVGPGV